MPALERRISLRGPRFWTDNDVLMFCNQIDGSTRDGPRPATDDDMEAHPDAFGTIDEPMQLIRTVDVGLAPPPAPKPHAERRARAAGAA